MQLTGPEILRIMTETKPQGKQPDIIIKPFDEKCLGSNSYDLHLADTLKIYKNTLPKGMKPAIEYKGDISLHDMSDWFENKSFYKDFIKNSYKYDIRNPKYTIDPCSEDAHETIEIKIPESPASPSCNAPTIAMAPTQITKDVDTKPSIN